LTVHPETPEAQSSSGAESMAQHKGVRNSITPYTVKPGDTFWAIARAHNMDVETLMALNDHISPESLQPGQTIHVIPDFQGVVYNLRPSDQLEEIMMLYDLTPNQTRACLRVAQGQPVRTGDIVFRHSERPQSARPMLASRGDGHRRYGAAVPAETQTPKQLPASEDSGPKPDDTPNGNWMWPIQGGVYSSEFGPRSGGFHNGLDIAVPAGTPAVAARGGTVTFAGWDGNYGYSVVIDHGDGYTSRYAHASSLLVKAGDAVQQGQTVILVGNTGYSTGPHLHFEIVTNGKPQNPRRFLP
jgi:murein DD-endopeptidase MepM/ murein hydrolase activator NlpD